MVKSRRHRSRKRSRKRKGAAKPTFLKKDLALGKGVAGMVKKGLVAEGIAMKQCNLIENQFKKKICTEKVAKAQKARAALAQKKLQVANEANAAANKRLGVVQQRIADIEKKVKENKGSSTLPGAGGRKRKRRTKRRRKSRKSKKSRRKSRKTKRRRKSKKRRSRRRR